MTYLIEFIIGLLWVNLLVALWILRRNWSQVPTIIAAYVAITFAATCATLAWVG